MKKFYFSYRKNQGLTLVELMTVLIIIMLLAMVGFPTYQEYQNRAYLAEAESIVGSTERSLRTYFLDHGTFYSADPTPAAVPGLQSLGSTATFTPTGGWLTLGTPIANGAEVNFSYQVFAGGTSSGSTVPITNSYLNSPTADMNLVRRVTSSSNKYFQNAVRTASIDRSMLLDFNIGMCSYAADQAANCKTRCNGNADPDQCVQDCLSGNSSVTCVEGCIQTGIDADTCNKKCNDPTDGSCSSPADPDCYSASSGQSAQQNCMSACVDAGKSTDQCNQACSNDGDGKCTDSQIGDIDCYHDTTSDSPTSPEFDKCIDGCGDDMSCREGCLNEYTDNSCYQKCEGDATCQQNCESKYHDYKCAAVLTDPEAIKKCQDSDNDTKDPEPCVKQVTLVDEENKDNPCANTGGGGGGGGGGTPPPSGGGGGGGGGGGETDEGSYSGGGGGSGNGPETDDGSESTDDGGTSEGSNAECASYGITKPTDFGILENQSNYNWVIVTATANLASGPDCTLVAKVLQAVGGKMQQTEFIKIKVGE